MEKSRHALAIHLRNTSQIQQWLYNISINIDRLFYRESARADVISRLGEYFAMGFGDEEISEAAFSYQLKQIKPVQAVGAFEKIATENINRLATLLALDSDESELLNFLLCANADETLSKLLEEIEIRSHHQFCEKLGIVLGIATKRMYAVLSPTAALLSYGLIDRGFGGNYVTSYLSMQHELVSILNGESVSDFDLMRPFFMATTKPTLSVDDFSHLASQVELAMRYLKSAIGSGTVGVNLLFYGLPGTGKSELARLLGQELSLTTYQVKVASEDGMSASAPDRLSSYLMAQKYLAASSKQLLIFDEIEDIFNDNGVTHFWGASGRGAPFGKNWLNQQLEENCVPTIWIANRVESVDAAHLRRFDYSIQFTTLPLAARTKIWRHHFRNSSLSETCETQLAARAALVPGQVALAAKVARALPDDLVDAIALNVINASMTLLRQEMPLIAIAPTEFDLSLANTDIDLPALLNGISRGDGNGYLCLAGPSGVGKTAFARLIAHHLKRPFRTITASDILSPYIGENEMNIARVFARAQANREVLIFDEAESLLSKREEARTRWECGLVNEFLAQLDAFRGMAIFTTNRHSVLDQAVSRRFDVNVFFNWLRLDQRVALLEKIAEQNVSDHELIVSRLKKLNCLAPSDFLAAKRKKQLLADRWSLPDWLTALEADCRFKIIDKDHISASS